MLLQNCHHLPALRDGLTGLLARGSLLGIYSTAIVRYSPLRDGLTGLLSRGSLLGINSTAIVRYIVHSRTG